jgi:hypothetical protein
MTINANAIFHPLEVRNSLSKFGATQEQFLEIVDAMVGARRSATLNHPPGAGAWMSWSEGTCRMREIFGPLGWDRNDDFHIPSITKEGIRIAVCNTDEGTGLLLSQPQNRNRKGAGTDLAISVNQGVFASILEESKGTRASESSESFTSWFLCVYCEGDTVRAELSCPLVLEDGYFQSFRERIILIGGDDNNLVPRRSQNPDGDLDYEIVVTRKQA